MGKNTMKTNRVAVLMMMMLGFVQILETEAIGFPCLVLCAIECIPKQPYASCFISCISKCPSSNSASNCARTCGVNKSITINIDALGNITSMTDSCLDKCLTLQ
ncbi:hypothetical protein PHAVU_011G083100 [Phaseolus vulgaris]|uniref:Thionin-like protein n=1 Tax=Phaseolus vulgaris TaxID=3885 RepID=V7AHF9_PHAVU|nr:hypothetical protein PHAVU_011G083100g [Phaseolus vulgaris]ESW04293.1 hypothetical protein PHAVU_011G083100g [Phaseolus vulgaris]